MLTCLIALPIALAAEPAIRVTSTGSEPRLPLRLDVATDHKSVVDIRVVTTMKMLGAGASMPPMRMGLSFAAREATPAGVRYDFEIVDVGVDGGDPMMVEAMRDAMGPMIGFGGTAVVDARGQTSSVEMKSMEGVPPEMSGNLDRSLAMVGAPLPEEAVGVGAIWTLEQQIDQQGLKVDQVTTWTLVSRDGPAVVLDTTVQQRAANQTLSDPSMPPGSTVTVTTFKSDGSGRTTLDLRSLVPQSSTMKMDLDMAMEAKIEGMSMPMDMSMGVEMTLAQRPPG